MQLLLSYFNKTKGPTIFLAYPAEISPLIVETIPQLMDLRFTDKFFEFAISDRKIMRTVNLFFKIPSEWSRGWNELILLTGVFERNIELPYLEYKFNQIREMFINEPDIYKGFYGEQFNNQNKEIGRKYDKIKTILNNSYMDLQRKIEQSQIIDRIFEQKPLQDDSTPSYITQTIVRTFISTIDARTPDGAVILYDIGTTLANKFDVMFKGNDIDYILNELSKFWRKNSFGEIDNIIVEKDGIHFSVYDCFECSHLPDIGRTVCRFDEGFVTTLLKSKLKQDFQVKEIECYASGFDHCRFQVKILEKMKSKPLKDILLDL